MVGLVHQHNPKTFDLQSILPEKCAKAMLSQNLCEWSTNNWFNLRPLPGEGAHVQYFLDGGDPETEYPRDLSQKKINKLISNNILICS